MGHSLREDNGQAQRRKGRRTFLLLFGLFAMPLLLVAAMYQFDWRPGGASHGQLVTPPRVLQLTDQTNLQGKPFRVVQWKEKWSLVYIAGPDCAAVCQEQLHTLRQVHVSLGKEIERLQRVLLVPADPQGAALVAIQQQYPDLFVLAGANVTSLASQFDLPGQPALSAGRVYLVDPLGNLMMSYPQGYEAKGLRKDLMRLLTYSWAG